MANDFVEGKVLEIPEDLLNNLEKIDENIKKIATDSENMGNKFNASIGTMDVNAGMLLQKLQSIKTQIGSMSSIGSFEIKGATNIGKFAEGLGTTATRAEVAASSITKAIEAINQLKSSLEQSGVKKSVLKQIDTLSMKEQANMLKELRNEAKETSRMLAQIDKNNALEAKKRANETKIAMQEEALATQKRVESIKRVGDTIKINISSLGRYTSALAMSETSEDARIKKIERLKSTMADLSKYGDRYAQEISLLSKKIDTLAKENERLAEARRKAAKEKLSFREDVAAINAYNRAMEASEATITQRTNKIAKLRAVEERMSKSSKDYSENIKRIREEIERLTKQNKEYENSHVKIRREQRKLMDTAGQLARKLALVFSVSQIQGYIKNMVSVTGEFEKQNVAIASILQNKDQADKLFAQITELAVKSPYQLKELVTYTKELSAYQIEYDKLYDTTKRLADVASGLGVDMGRLILAFGQVKAANYLRGTEVRQFTEAGFNMLGELSKYYSELEGRLISVGEVQEMVTKRMVSFGDVEEVFKRVTSAGGIFYDMQEKQAETIAGQISNLSDSIDIMLNEIGKANEGTIRNVLSSLTNLLENWRELAWYIEKAAWALGVWKATSMVVALGNAKMVKSLFRVKEMTEASTASLNKFGKSLLALKSLGRGLLVGGALLLVGWLVDLYRESTKARRELDLLQKSLDNLVMTDFSQLDKEVDAFDDLIARYKLSNEGTQERRDLISSLNSNYGEYLNFLVEENTSVEKLEGAYDDVVKKMKEKSALQTLEKGFQEINKFYTDNLEEAKEEFEDSLIIKVGKENLEPTKKDIENLVNITQSKVREMDDNLLDTVQKRRELASKILREYFGEEVTIYSSSAALVELMISKKKKELDLQESINSSNKETMKTREANIALDKRELALQKEKKDIYANFKGTKFEVNEKIKEAEQKYELDRIDIKLEFGEISEESAKDAKNKIINWGSELTRSFNDMVKSSLEGISKEDMSKILISPEEEAAGISSVIKNTKDGYESQNAIIEQQIQLKNQGLSVDEDQLERAIKMKSLYKQRADFLGIDLKYTEKINQKELESINAQLDAKYKLDLVDSLKSTLQLQDEYNKKYKEAEKMVEMMNNQKARGVVIDEAALAIWEERKDAYDKISKLLGSPNEEDKKHKKNKEPLTILKEQISLVRKAGEEYKKLQKYYSDEEANKKVRDSFADAFKELGLSIDMDFDTRGIISGIDNITNTAGEDGRKAIKKATSDLKAEVDIELREEDLKNMKDKVDNLFDSYKLSIELNKSGINKGFISDLFNIEIFSLDDVKKNLQDMKPLFYNQGKEYVKVWDEAEKKVTKMQNEETEKRMKKYVGFLKKAYGERASILMEANEQMKEVRELDFPQEKEDAIVKRIKEDRDKKLSEISWKEFKESDLYIQMFENLEAKSTQSIDYILKKLGELRESLGDQDPQALKEIVSNMEKLREVKVAKNPFKGLIKNIKEVISYQKDSIDLNKRYAESLDAEDALREEATVQELNVKAAEDKYLAAKKSKGEFSEETMLAKINLDGQKEILDTLLKQLEVQGKITKEQADQIREGNNKKKELADRLSEISSATNQLASIDIVGDLEQIFGNMDEGTKDAIESFQELLGGVSELEDGISDMLNGRVFTGAVKVLTSPIKMWASLFRIGDKKKEREIKRQIKLVEDLKEAYEDLAEATDKAYSTDELQKGTEQMNRNLEARNQALQASIKKEEDKKKTDHNRIKEWQKEIDANNKQIAENKKNLLAELGGFGSDDRIKSAAEEFTSSWLDSYLQVGQGLDGLQDKMNDWLKNAVQKQLLTNLSKEFVTPLLKQFDEMFSDESLGGANMLPEEAAAWKDLYESKSKEFNERAEAYLEALKAMGIDLGAVDKQDELSGLQRGLQAITSEQADALSSIVESVRYFSSDSNMQLKTIVNALTNPEFESPMISELRLQTEQVRSINSLMNSFTKTKAGISGRVLKVEIL